MSDKKGFANFVSSIILNKSNKSHAKLEKNKYTTEREPEEQGDLALLK